MIHTFQLPILFVGIFSHIKTDAFDLPLIEVGVGHILNAVVNFPRELLSPPANNDNSIQYLLYTPNNMKKPCRIQPSAKRFDKCSFSASYETKFLVHGFAEFLEPENLFNVLKDAILKQDNYNVIVMNWTSYNTFPYWLAYKNAKPVGERLADMMKFIETYTKVSLKTFHCIGHSLGSHICAVASRIVQILPRITALDPGGFYISEALLPDIHINYTDADFVDVMHTSNIYSLRGIGYPEPRGHLDFYPNGGVDQPRCVKGNTYKAFEGRFLTVKTTLDLILCNHLITIEYFTHSLKNGGKCKFIATECKSYSAFEDGLCSSGIKADMGFFSKKTAGIPPLTKFYLTTRDSPPYCH